MGASSGTERRDPQWAVAVDLQLHYSRVSQIVKKVEQWLAAGGSPTDPEIRDHVARRRLSHANHKLRVVRAIVPEAADAR